MIGFFVNTLALRSDLSGNPSFTSVLQKVKETTLNGYDHQHAPFEKVVDRVVKNRDMSTTPLFQTLFVLQNIPDENGDTLEGITIKPYTQESNTAQFDLSFYAIEEEKGISFRIEYATSLFKETTIHQMVVHFEELLKDIVKNPDQGINNLSMLTAAEEKMVFQSFNTTEVAYPKDKTLVDLFGEQVVKTPNAIAIAFEGLELTYQELDQKSNQLAHYLRSKGIEAESLVGICIDRSLEMMIGILGILKSGGAYVPIDPKYPTARINYIIDDAAIDFVLSSSDAIEALQHKEKLEIVLLDSDWGIIAKESSSGLAKTVAPENLAYVIYTSPTQA